MKFKKYLRESRLDKLLDKIIKKHINEDTGLSESSCVDKIKSAIADFIEIMEFKWIIDPRKTGITINGEFRGGEEGSKHIELDCKDIDIKSLIEDLNTNIDKINYCL